MVSLRIKIAKLLAPEWDEEFQEGERLIAKIATDRKELTEDNLHLRDALMRILGQRTLGANSTVKRMADIADSAILENVKRRRLRQ